MLSGFVPVGVGTAGWILALVVINTKYNFLVPYAYTGIDYLVALRHRSGANLPMSLGLLSLGVFAVVILAGQVLYFRKGTQN